MKKDDVLLNHERIHLKQQLELLILPFYIWYGLEWLVKWCIYKDRYIAYKNISFEREAYFHESNLDYLKKRRIFEFLKYF